MIEKGIEIKPERRKPMKETIQLLQEVKPALLQGITEEELQELGRLGAFRRAAYEKHTCVLSVGQKVQELGIVLAGSVLIESNDLWGNRSIIGKAARGQVFAESYAVSGTPLMVDVFAAQDAEILFLNGRMILGETYSGYPWYGKILKNLLTAATSKNLSLSSRIFCTTAKTVRGRLAVYFSEQMTQNGSREFEIPFNRQQMADFLNLDRSALSKELGKMREEGLILFHKNHFVLLQPVE